MGTEISEDEIPYVEENESVSWDSDIEDQVVDIRKKFPEKNPNWKRGPKRNLVYHRGSNTEHLRD